MTVIFPRLHLLFAAETPVCVILRRGPSEWVHVLKWNTDTDAVESGAWFHGRIYEYGCDVSPDGKLFVYFAAQYRPEREEGYDNAWTGISKPPWLTALAMWPSSDTWGGNAYFADNRTLVIDCPHWEQLAPHPNHQPNDIDVVPRWIGREAPDQRVPPMPHKVANWNSGLGRDQTGRVFRVQEGQLIRDVGGVPRVIADFRDMRPEPIASPAWARQW